MKIILASAFIFVSSFVSGQEFWLQPKKFKCNIGEDLKIDFLIGENFVGESWDLSKNKIEKLELHQLNKQVDLKNQIKPEDKDKLIIKLTEVGTYIVSIQSGESIVNRTAQEFNDYIKTHGLDEISNVRIKTNSLDKPVKEISTQYAKLIVQCGNETSETFKKDVGLKIEIVPLQNPYKIKSGDYLVCLILFDGKPLPHQPIRLWNIIGNASIQQNTFTENDGKVKFPISSKGPWMVSTVKMIASKNSTADWQSFSTSLTFGIE